MHIYKTLTRTAAVGALAMFGASSLAQTAEAAHLDFTTFEGNDCTGNDAPSGGDSGFTTGNGLGECSYDGSPVIARLGIDDDGEFESFFTGVTRDDFTVERVEDLDDGNGGTTFGYSFTYTPDAGDPLITAFAAKGGNAFNLYDGYDGEETFTTATFITPLNNGGNRAGLSHITFFDTDGGTGPVDPGDPMAPIPLPAAGWMLLAGVGGLAAMRRRRKS